jgi:hypothetical protein
MVARHDHDFWPSDFMRHPLIPIAGYGSWRYQEQKRPPSGCDAASPRKHTPMAGDLDLSVKKAADGDYLVGCRI